MSGTRYNLRDIPVYAFDGRNAKKLNELIRLADSAPPTNDIKVAKRGWTDSSRLVRFVQTAPRLALSRTNKEGSFAMEIPDGVAEIIVVAYAPSEEGSEFEYAYARAATVASLKTRVIIAFAVCERQ